MKRKKIVATAAEPQEDSYNERSLNSKNLSISPSALRLIEPSTAQRVKDHKKIRYGQISEQQKEYKRIVNMYSHQERI